MNDKRKAIDRAVEMVAKNDYSIAEACRRTGCSPLKLTCIMEAQGLLVEVEGFTMRMHKDRAAKYAVALKEFKKTGSMTKAAHKSDLCISIVHRYILRLGIDARQTGIEIRSKQIKALREANPYMTRAEIAVKLGVSPSTVTKYWKTDTPVHRRPK